MLQCKTLHNLSVFVDLGIQHATRMRHIVNCGASGSTMFFPHYLSNGKIFEKELLYIKKCILISLQLLSETFVILKRYDHKHILVFVCSTCYSCLILMKVIFLWIFEKYTNIKFRVNPSSGSRVVPCGQTDRRTDRHDKSNSRFLKFCERA